nr:hypothetical protein [Tanacetum cinerariifolium]
MELKIAQTTTNDVGTSTTHIPGPVTTIEKAQKKNDVKARSMLLMALPNEHLITFNQYKDAKTLFAAIETRFGRNEATKKTQKTLLKHLYKNFSATSIESLNLFFNRLQKIVGQLAVLGVFISQEDLNLKFLRSLSSEWNTHVVVWRNKSDLHTMSIDDLYNNFKIVKQEVKETTSINSSSQNMAFVSSPSLNSTNEVSTGFGVSTASAQVSTANLSDATVYAFLANQPNGSQHMHEELKQIHEDDLEEIDLKWQLALLSMRAKRFFQKTELVFIGATWVMMKLPQTWPLWLFQTQRGLASVEEQLVHYEKNVSLLNENIAVLKRDILIKDIEIAVLKNISVKISEYVKEKNNAPLIEDWESEGDDEVESPPEIERKTIKPSVDKVEVDIPKQNNKPARRPVKYADYTEHKDLRVQIPSEGKDGNISYLTDFKEFDGGYVAFGGGAKGGKITGKGIIITGKLDFKDVYFVKELQFNHFSISQMCDKKNSVLFTDTECFVLSPDFKLADESHVLLKVPRKNNMYIVDIKNIVPKKDLTCLNRVLVVKPHFKIPYEPFRGRTHALSFMRPFGCHVTIPNILNHLEKFDGKSDEGFFVGYSTNSKAFRVYNTRTRKVEENMHINFLENKPIITGDRPKYLFDIDALTESINYIPVIAGINSNDFVGNEASFDACQSSMETGPSQDYFLMPLWNDDLLFDSSSKDSDGDNKDNDGPCKESEIDNQERPNAKNNTKDVNTDGPSINTASSNINTASPTVNNVRQSDDFFGADNDMRSLDGAEVDISNISNTYPVPTTLNTRIHKDHSFDNVIGDMQSSVQTRRMTLTTDEQGFISAIYEEKTHKDLHTCLFAYFLSQEEPKRITNALKDPAWVEAMAIGTKWVFRNKKDERGIVIRNKSRLVSQGFTQEKGIDYDEVFALVARIKAIRLFLAYASFMGLLVYQIDVKSAFLYGRIEEEVYVCQPLGFKDLDYPDKVYKVEKALYGLHQAPRAWYETFAKYLLDNGFHRGKIDQTLFIKRQREDILLVQVYVDDIIFGSTKKELCTEFEKLMHNKFQMSSMGELTFLLGFQVKQKSDGIFISQDKYVNEILRKFKYADVKPANTPMDKEKAFLKDSDGNDVDVHLYRSMIGSLMYLTSSRPDIMLA